VAEPTVAAASTTDLARAVAERTLSWSEGCFYWGDAIAYDGLLAVDDHLHAGYGQELADRLDRWHRSAPDSWDDALAPGAAAASLVARGQLSPAVLERIVAAMTRLPRSAGVPLLRPHVPGWRTLVWVDSLYHLPITLVAAGRQLDRPELVEDGIQTAQALLRVLAVDSSLGHAYDAGLRRGTGVRWTRGIGWALLGLLDVAAVVPEEAAGLAEVADRLLTQLQGSQRPHGAWPTVLERDDADDETSVAGFFVTAARHPAVPGHRQDELAAAAAAGLRSLTEQVAADGTVAGVSHDTHVTWSVEDYLHPATLASPWGQGAALRALATDLGSPA